jgi:hypothetical protein
MVTNDQPARTIKGRDHGFIRPLEGRFYLA